MNLEPGDDIQVEFPDGWQDGWTFLRTVGATDRECRIVAKKGSLLANGIAPECVKPINRSTE